jgi:hypothetical protein
MCAQIGREAVHGVRTRYLLGAMPQMFITMTLRTQCIDDEVQRVDEVMSAWRAASSRMQELTVNEAGLADGVLLEGVDPSMHPLISELGKDSLFKASFSAVPTTFAMVKIDTLVAPQRQVNMDYVEALEASMVSTELSNVVELCLKAGPISPKIKRLQTAANQITFSSSSNDLRFLGGFAKAVGPDDLDVAYGGGRPVAAVAMLVGYGAAPINVWSAAGRLILNNGFHRVVALRRRGVEHIPVVVQHAANAEIDFPSQILGLSREYLLGHRRPVLVRDFFDDALTVELRLKEHMKTVRLSWVAEDGVVATGE